MAGTNDKLLNGAGLVELWSIIKAEDEKKATTSTMEVPVSTDWLADDANGGYIQMVELEGILATDNPIPDVVMGDDVAANELYAKAWSCITRIVTEDDMVTLYANKEAPTTAFTMQLKVVR